MRHGRSPQPTTIILNRTLIACTGGASAASGPSSTGGRNSTWISKLVLLQLFMLFQGPGLKKIVGIPPGIAICYSVGAPAIP